MSNAQSWTAKLPESARERLTGRQIAKLKSNLARTKQDLAAAEARAEKLASRLEQVSWCLRMATDAIKDRDFSMNALVWRVECDDGDEVYIQAPTYKLAVKDAVEAGLKPVDGVE